MTEPRWVLPAVVRAIHRAVVAEHGGSDGIRDRALLESALSRPRQRWAYDPVATIPDLAATYADALANHHPFVDGNKRVALVVSAVFLAINGYRLDAPEAEAAVMFEALAAGTVSEAALATWFAAHVVETGVDG